MFSAVERQCCDVKLLPERLFPRNSCLCSIARTGNHEVGTFSARLGLSVDILNLASKRVGNCHV